MNLATIHLADGSSLDVPVSLADQATGHTARISREAIPPQAVSVDFMPEYLTARTGDDGYLVVPHGHRWSGSFISYFTERPDTEFVSSGCILPFFGIRQTDQAILAVVTGMPYDFEVVASVTGGRYRVYARFQLDGDAPYEDLCIQFVSLTGQDASYAGMARRFRQMQLEAGVCRPLKERLNPELAYAAQAIEIRIRLGWKPVPSPVLEQTVETEPPMHVAMTFRQVEDLLDSLSAQGIDKAQICLVGWNQKGHDGRWPQAFPVEEALGGEAGLRRLIAKAQRMGYQIVCHTNHSDAYRIADSWDERDLIKNKNAGLSQNTVWSGGQMYNICPARSVELAGQMLPRVAELGFRGLHYVDVLSVVHPRKCHDPAHPQHRGQTVANLRQVMERSRELFGGFASEGTYWFAAGRLDFGLYVTFNLLGKQPDIADRIVPLWQLVYHGIVLSNPSSETVNVPIKSWQAQLIFHEHGGRPLIYLQSKFVSGNRVNWMGEQDLTADTPEAMAASVAKIKETYVAYQAARDRQLAFMDEHDYLTDKVCRTRYSDGSEFVYNYGETPYTVAGLEVLPHTWSQVHQ
ncbi:MAG: hypothetical protein GX112_07985 [Clostridiaceae bacterium]|nr:hypothetical protein [Clostridiaceae bacterium]